MADGREHAHELPAFGPDHLDVPGRRRCGHALVTVHVSPPVSVGRAAPQNRVPDVRRAFATKGPRRSSASRGGGRFFIGIAGTARGTGSGIVHRASPWFAVPRHRHPIRGVAFHISHHRSSPLVNEGARSDGVNGAALRTHGRKRHDRNPRPYRCTPPQAAIATTISHRANGAERMRRHANRTRNPP